MFAGLVHDLGVFYLMSRAANFPELVNDKVELHALLVGWHDSIGHALLSALGMATGEDDDGAAAVPAAPPIPGFRSSLMDAVGKLDLGERELLRAWLAEEGLPDRPSAMNAEQADRVCDYIMHGMPKAFPTEADE